MPIRTNALLVREVMAPGKDYDGRSSLTPFILKASLIVNRVAICATSKGTPLSVEELLVMETWLAAHNYCCSDNKPANKSTSGASGSYQGQTGKGIEGTTYGLGALESDPSGCLRGILLPGQKVGAFWLGKSPSAQTDYDDRD
jgi:hypothetical protein